MNENYITIFEKYEEYIKDTTNSVIWDELTKDALLFYQAQKNEEKRNEQLNKLRAVMNVLRLIEKYCIKERDKQGVIFPIHPASDVENLLPTDKPVIQSFINRLSDGRVNENKRFLKKNEMEIVNKMWKIYKPIYDIVMIKNTLV